MPESGAIVPYDFNHRFNASAGADTFDFVAGGDRLDRRVSGEVNFIDGGTAGAGVNATQPYLTPREDDLVKLPGAAGDYAFSVVFGSSLATTRTVIVRSGATTLGTKPTVTIDATNIQLVTFANATIVNTVVGLTLHSLIAEAAQLADEAYGPRHPPHFQEALASDASASAAETSQVGAAAVARGWHEVSAIELGMPAANFSAAGNLQYAFASGFYQAITRTNTLDWLNTESNALVLIGVVNGKTTLAVVFRGTDQASDAGDFSDFRTNQYESFRPLVSALQAYVQGHSIDQILVSGHSMGGALAQLFAQDMPADKIW